VGKWLPIDQFSLIDIRPAVKRLHEFEEKGMPIARSHGIDYRTLQGRRFSARSASAKDPLFGEEVLDAALSNVRQESVGHMGNFYWIPPVVPGEDENPLTREVHVILVADKGRVNFPTANPEGVVRHVLRRVRALST
jgi:hypothetical protein